MIFRNKRSGILAGSAAVALAAAGLVTAVSASAAAGCRVDYKVSTQWPGGFIGEVTINNLGDPINGWTLAWDYSAGQRVTQAWNGASSQSGSRVTVRSVSYNSNIATNGSVGFGFNGAWNGSNPVPTNFSLNGTACNGGVAPTTAPTTRPPTTSPTTRPPTTPPTGQPPTTAPPTTRPPTTQPTGQPPTGTWPTPSGNAPVNNGSIDVPRLFDGGMKRYCCIGDGGQGESQDPVFVLAPGATIKNVILGAPAGDGIHCEGDCTIENVWWEDVGEDGATFRGGSNYYVIGGGARSATDKLFQHNGGGTVHIRNFYAENVGKLYRACGNCSSSFERHVVFDNVTVKATKVLAGINTNWGDTARFSRITVYGKATICEKYKGVPKGSEPSKIGEGADGVHCIYRESDISYR